MTKRNSSQLNVLDQFYGQLLVLLIECVKLCNIIISQC